MKVTSIDRDGLLVLKCEGALSVGAAAEAFETACRPGIEKARGIVLDLSQVAYVDSMGIATIVACTKRAAEKRAVIKVVLAPQGAARRAFEITQLDRVFEIFEDVDSAIASYS